MAEPDTLANNQLTDAVLALVLQVPGSQEQAVAQPALRAHVVARKAARNASLIASSLSLPPGFLGWLTVLPELLGVWRLQAQMVSDIAAVYGKHKTLGREQMLYCLFKHMSAQLFRDVIVRVGERALVRQTSLKLLQALVKQLGAQVTQTVIRKSAARFVPLLGAVGVGAYAYFDTLQVAKTAVELFEREIVIEVEK
ncbi:hypothetical protein [Rhodoferax saidenbachensis]|uniref:EcsC family protein n=1 Tax=Rhodoferax saidenbachensis TaxID=1484693 RepID=A0A1P8K9H1_9BURK|nr:hypothetical protein [Rhodoferax saidenbachensis]APW42664.1 hypothetical protein RS694_09050 [Rhodoferax saidenbachensis]